MTRRCVWMWTLVGLCLLPTAARAQSTDYLSSGPLREAGLAKFWQLQLPLEVDQCLRDAFLVEDTLYLATQDGYVYAVDAYTGVIRWLQPVTRSGYHLRRPCHAGERVIFVTPVDVQVYDRRTGEGISRRDMRFPTGSAPVTDGQRIFVGGLEARLHALSVGTQRDVWRVTTGAPMSSAPAIWDLADRNDPKPEDRNYLVYAADEIGDVYACTRGKKAFVWQSRAYGPVSADLVASDKGIYVASRDQSLYLFDLAFGQVRWRARFSSPLYEAPFVTPDLVYQYSAGDGLVAVETGQAYEVKDRFRWKLPDGRAALTTDDKFVFVLGADCSVLAVRQKDGEVAYRIPTAGMEIPIPAAPADGVALFIASPDGRIFSARSLKVPFLRQQDVLNALRAPGAASQPAVASAPTSQPAEAGLLRPQRGVPSGGQSKVSKEFKERQ
jgi:eukaryotic-like serine/threonine-protein kinase